MIMTRKMWRDDQWMKLAALRPGKEGVKGRTVEMQFPSKQATASNEDTIDSTLAVCEDICTNIFRFVLTITIIFLRSN